MVAFVPLLKAAVLGERAPLQMSLFVRLFRGGIEGPGIVGMPFLGTIATYPSRFLSRNSHLSLRKP